MFDLTLLNNLELGLTLKRKAASLEQVKELLFLNVSSIKIIGVLISVNIVSFLD